MRKTTGAEFTESSSMVYPSVTTKGNLTEYVQNGKEYEVDYDLDDLDD